MDRERLAGATAGGFVAGLGITVMLMAMERRSGVPSELASLRRAGARRLGFDAPPDEVLPGAGEQLAVQGGHLLLSAAAGAAYGALTPKRVGTLPSGIVFGFAFYASMHWIAGPLLGLKKPEWRSEPAAIALHTTVHLLFGLTVALGARAATHRS